MPNSIEIAFFVFGAILLLIALLGGNFKLFGADIASTVANNYIRFLSFFLGCFFIGLVLFPINKVDSRPRPIPPVSTTQTSTNTIDLSGSWASDIGVNYEIEQDGTRLKVVESALFSTRVYRGTIKTNKVKLIREDGAVINMEIEDETTLRFKGDNIVGEEMTAILSKK